jgi:hypothetical protein
MIEDCAKMIKQCKSSQYIVFIVLMLNEQRTASLLPLFTSSKIVMPP